MPRISTDPRTFAHRPSLATRLALRASRRMMGGDADTVGAMAHRPGVLFPWALLETTAQRGRSVLPPHLPELVTFVVSVRLGCSWCIDFGASRWEQQGLDPQVLRHAVTWRQAPAEVFDDATRAAFAYAEAMSAEPVEVDDAMVAALVAHVGEDGVVEISFWAALENMRGRFNSALGLTSQGFSSGDACALAAAQPASR
jgi:AhpD family alkylhydroperoxidase